MPFAFKLAHRFARIRRLFTVVASAVVFAQCEAVPSSDLTAPSVKTNRRVFPHQVTDLTAKDPTDSSATISFTEVDDGTQKPSNYEIRYGVAPVKWEETTSITSSTCDYPLAGSAIGTQRTCVVEGLAPSTNYEFQLAPFRRGPAGDTTVGPLSAAAPITTLAAVAAVYVTPAAISIVVGQGVQLTAIPLDASGTALTRTSVWISSDTSIAVVSQQGTVLAKRAGTATIAAIAGGRLGQARVTAVPVASSPGAVTDLTATVANDSTVMLSFTEVTDGTGRPANYDVRFAISPMSFSSGTDVSAGSCRMPTTGTTIGARRTCSVMGLKGLTSYGFQLASYRGTWGASDAVYGPFSNQATATTPTRVSSVSVTPGSLNSTVGQTAQLTATVRDASGNPLSGRTVTWSSSATSVAQVSSSGLVTAAGTGTATIVATSEGKSGQAQITVTAPAPTAVASVTLAPTPASLTAGQTLQLTATLRDAGGNLLSGRAITWSSSSTAVAQVNGSGLVTAAAAGSATITATAEGRTGQAQITVGAAVVPVATVTVAPATVTVQAGQTTQLAATLRDASGNILSGRVVTWASSATGVARVSSTGLVTGVAGGTANVTATAGGISGTSRVTVPAPTVATVSITPSTVSLAVGQSTQLTATLRDATGNVLTGQSVTWSSTAATVAAVSGGMVTANNAGSATISATASGVSGSASVSVTPPVTPPPTTGLAFLSSWSTALGTSDAALKDGGKWTGNLCTGTVAEVVSASALDMPTTNAFRFAYAGPSRCYMVHTTGKWPAPAVGQSIFYRWYFRSAVGDGQELGQAHWLQATSIQSWEWKIKTPSGGRYQLYFQNLSGAYKADNYAFAPLLNTNSTYIMEQRFTRINSTTAAVAFRILNSAGQVVATSAEFLDDNRASLRGRTITFGASDADYHTLELGNNDPNTSGVGNVFVSGFAVRISADTSAWIGR